MNPEWLCYVDGQEYGPYTWPQLVQMAQAGNVVPQTHVRRNFDSQWYLAEQVPGLFSAPVAPTNPKSAAHPAAPAKSASGAKKALSKSGTQPAYLHQQPVAKAAPKAAPAAAPLLPEPITSQPAVQPAAAVAAPVTTGSVPKGRVISKTPTAIAPAANKPIPLQQSAQHPAADLVIPKVALAPASETDAAGLPPRRKDNSKQLVLYLGGAILGVALVGGLALIYKFTRPPEVPQEVAKTPVVIPSGEADPNVVAEEVNPADDPTAAQPKAAEKNAAKPGAKTETAKANNDVAGASPATTTLVRTVATWKPIEKFGSVGLRNGLTVTKMNAYLAADANGRKVAVRTTGGAPPIANAPADNAATASVAPSADGNATETPAIIAPTPTPAPAGPLKYTAAEAAPFLFVELTITNKDTTKPQNYAGWNNGDTAAVLVDAAGKEFKLVAASATPGASRQKAREVKPGETFQDTLVFDVPPNSDLHFRVILPQFALSPRAKNSPWGYEIGGGYLASAATAQVAEGVGPDGKPAPPKLHSSGGNIPIPGLQDPPAPMPQPPPPAVPADPPTAEPEMKKPAPTEKIPIPGLEPETKPAAPKKPDEVPNLAPPPVKKK